MRCNRGILKEEIKKKRKIENAEDVIDCQKVRILFFYFFAFVLCKYMNIKLMLINVNSVDMWIFKLKIFLFFYTEKESTF